MSALAADVHDGGFGAVFGDRRGSGRPRTDPVAPRLSPGRLDTPDIIAALDGVKDVSLADGQFSAVAVTVGGRTRAGFGRPTFAAAAQDAGLLHGDIKLVARRDGDDMLLLDLDGGLVHNQPAFCRA